MNKETILIEKLDSIISKLDNIEERINVLENKTKDIHQFVPFVGWLDNISKKIISIPKLSWLSDNSSNFINNNSRNIDYIDDSDDYCDD